MKDFEFVTHSGIPVILNDFDMHQIHTHYEVMNLADYLLEMYDSISDDFAVEMAMEVRNAILTYGYDEDEAIKETVKSFKQVVVFADDESVLYSFGCVIVSEKFVNTSSDVDTKYKFSASYPLRKNEEFEDWCRQNNIKYGNIM